MRGRPNGRPFHFNGLRYLVQLAAIIFACYGDQRFPPHGIAQDLQRFLLDLTDAFSATDYDGDAVTLGSDSITVVVENDVPAAASGTASIRVEEDELSTASGTAYLREGT